MLNELVCIWVWGVWEHARKRERVRTCVCPYRCVHVLTCLLYVGFVSAYMHACAHPCMCVNNACCKLVVCLCACMRACMRD